MGATKNRTQKGKRRCWKVMSGSSIDLEAFGCIFSAVAKPNVAVFISMN